MSSHIYSSFVIVVDDVIAHKLLILGLLHINYIVLCIYFFGWVLVLVEFYFWVTLFCKKKNIKTKEYSKETRSIVIVLNKFRKRNREILGLQKKPRPTVAYIVKNFTTKGTIYNNHRPGRLRATTSSDEPEITARFNLERDRKKTTWRRPKAIGSVLKPYIKQLIKIKIKDLIGLENIINGQQQFEN